MNAKQIYEKYRQKVSDKLGYRPDLSFADFRCVNKDVAQIAVSYSIEGAITAEDVVNYVRKTFDDQVAVIPGSIKAYPEHNVVVAVTALRTDRRPWDDHKKMLCLAAKSLYLDTELEETWTVALNDDDKPYLVRVRKDDIQGILNARKVRMNKMHTMARHDVVVAEVVGLSTAPMKGDKVRVYVENKIQDGEVESQAGKGFSVKLKNGRTITVPPQSIIEVKDRGESFDRADKEMQIEFYTKVYDDAEFARKLVGASVYSEDKPKDQPKDIHFAPPPLENVRARATFRKISRDNGRREWAFVSSKDPNRVLGWIGPNMPSDEDLAKAEKKVNYFDK